MILRKVKLKKKINKSYQSHKSNIRLVSLFKDNSLKVERHKYLSRCNSLLNMELLDRIFIDFFIFITHIIRLNIK